ncbi:MAG: inorganic phosphate transporter [Thermoplasmata archaeon]|nr:inorganic phosphate transporter [Thermoplasmata archaeon]
MELLGLSALALITIGLTLAFEFVNGFHDSANSIATVVATKVLSPVYAVGLAAVFNFMGIFLGIEVAKTMGKGIIDTALLTEYGIPLVFCAIMGAIIWDIFTWWFGIPTSSSHALIGGLVGAGGAVWFVDAVVWSSVLKTIAFIVISPIAGMAIAFCLAVLVMRIAKRASKSLVNKWFRKLQIGSMAYLSVTHGTNDAQKGMGIIATVIMIEAGTLATGDFLVENWMKFACGGMLALGTFFGGWRIVKTMASRITKLDPYQGFCAETGAATMLLVTAIFGIPVSTTHTASGAIMGVGATKRASAVRWGVGRKIVIAWILTIPAAATISGLMFLSYVWFF